jgi:hypothetical protein
LCVFMCLFSFFAFPVLPYFSIRHSTSAIDTSYSCSWHSIFLIVETAHPLKLMQHIPCSWHGSFPEVDTTHLPLKTSPAVDTAHPPMLIRRVSCS